MTAEEVFDSQIYAVAKCNANDDVLQTFQILEVSLELIQVIKEANEHNYISDAELYDQEPDIEEKFEEFYGRERLENSIFSVKRWK